MYETQQHSAQAFSTWILCFQHMSALCAFRFSVLGFCAFSTFVLSLLGYRAHRATLASTAADSLAASTAAHSLAARYLNLNSCTKTL